MAAAHRSLTERTGSPHLAAADLTEALARRRVRSICRSADGERWRIPLRFWADYRLEHWSDGLHVMKRPPPRASGPRIITPVRGYVFYAWQPDIDAIWPPAPSADDSERRKPGPQPTKNWKVFLAAELARRIEAKERVPAASELAQWCENELGFQPDLRQIHRLIKQLL